MVIPVVDSSNKTDFIKRLEYLLSLDAKKRWNSVDWRRMAAILKENGRWKAKARGMSFTKEYKCGNDIERIDVDTSE